MAVTLPLAKSHMRIEYDDEDAYIGLLINVATDYVSSITGIENDEHAPKTYDLVCLLLISHWFANRESVSIGSYIALPHAFDMLLQSLRGGHALIGLPE